MRWTSLGHAMWLAEAGEVRILFDPLLAPTHHGDVFALNPPRTVDEAALRADFIVVTHRHPDHFDVPSLARLARRDPDAVVVTPDPLVERTARRLGFRTVARVDAWHRIELAGAALITTPSLGEPLEWGVVVVSPEGVVFNQVDSVLGGSDRARTFARAIGERAGPIDLALVRWQPALEVGAVLSGHIGFPYRAYETLLDEIAALGAAVLAPTAAGVRHTDRYRWLNRAVYPLTEQRFLRDAARRCPEAQVVGAPPGTVLELAGGALATSRGSPLVAPEEGVVERFAPFAMEPLADPNPKGRDPADMRRRIDRFVERLTRALPTEPPRRLVLEVVYPADRDFLTFRIEGGAAVVERGFDDDYDVYDAVAASYLVDVIEGARHWGEVLLGGMLRASVRAYRVSAEGLAVVEMAPIFLYYALSYDESHERWVEHQLAALAP